MTDARPGVQPEDLFRLDFLQDAQLSPDGKMVAYALQQVDAETDAEQSAIYLQAMESGEVRQLTNGVAQDSAPRWSPDGKQLAFSSTRSGKPQIFLIAADGGEARQLTTLPQGISGGVAWSPDGRQLAFTAPPQAEPADPADPYRLTRAVYRFDKMGYLHRVISDIYVIDVAGGEAKALTQDEYSNDAPVWSPDGQRLLYMVTMFPDSHRIGAALRTVDLDGTTQDVIWAWGKAAGATWTRDGRQVVFIGNPEGLPIGTQEQLWVVDVAGTGGTAPSTGCEPRCLTPNFGYKIGGGLQMDMPLRFLRTPRLFVSEDNRAVYVQAQVGGTVPIYRVALADTAAGQDAWHVVVGGDRACFPIDLRGDQLIYFQSTHHDPVQLYAVDLIGGGTRQLTHLNAALLAQWDQPEIKRLQFAGSDGVPVEGWILLPTGAAAPHPTILYIHGGPHSAFGHIFSFDFRLLASAGYAVLFINQRASTGYGDAFATQIKGDWGNLDYRDLMAGVDYAIGQGLVDGERMGVCGLSGGGNLSCWIVGQTDRFKAAVPENPVTNWVSFYGVSDIGPWFAVEQLGGRPHEIPEIYARCSPITYAHRCTTPTLLIQGEHDWRCPAEQSEQFYSVLKANGCPVEMVRLPGSAHGGSIDGPPKIRRAHNEALLAWMQRYV
ncbi:MAG: S9 family peptidase [Caldilineaceae bacterium]|nr:S9 family peptidase [Caldilineaceae bacterium]